MRSGAVVLTVDPAAPYAGLLLEREDIHYACAHPRHPSVFLERTTKEERQGRLRRHCRAAGSRRRVRGRGQAKEDLAETVIRQMYAPVIDVHWVTVKQPGSVRHHGSVGHQLP